MQSASLRIEETRMKSRDTDQWMSYRHLPEDLKERIRRYEQYRWQETSGVDEEQLLMNLPKDLRRDIKRHLCLSLLMRVCYYILPPTPPHPTPTTVCPEADPVYKNLYSAFDL